MFDQGRSNVHRREITRQTHGNIGALLDVGHELSLREAADRAAFDLIAGLESNDLEIFRGGLNGLNWLTKRKLRTTLFPKRKLL
jgi:hypothetical protein